MKLGFRLVFKGGKEALTRLLLTTIAVAIGVVVLLAAIADFHAVESYIGRPYWEGTQAMTNQHAADSSNVELWNYSQDFYKGQVIERLDVAALGPNAPVLPGLTNMPNAGRYYASPALVSLLHSASVDELGNRFPGTLVGSIGDKALSNPSELVVVIGYQPAQLASLPNTVRVNQISTAPESSWSWASPAEQSSTKNDQLIQFGLSAGIVAMLVPIIVLISTATRLSATRREERYAAMRLVGTTPRQIRVIASIDAFVAAIFGAILGIGVFALLRPLVADLPIVGAKFFSYEVTPTAIGYLTILVGVPFLSMLIALRSLKKVQISPLGVSRKVAPSAPKIWGLVPLALGIILFAWLLQAPNGGLVYLMLALVMIGLIVAGPWLTMQVTRLFSRFIHGGASLIAVRRLQDNPRVAFRMISGIVLAVFVSTILAAIVPAVYGAEATTANDAQLNNVMRAVFTDVGSRACANLTTNVCVSKQSNIDAAGLAPGESTRLIDTLSSYPGVSVIPFYSILKAQKQFFQAFQLTSGPPSDLPNYNTIVSCASLKELPLLGKCMPGARAAKVYPDQLLEVNKIRNLDQSLPIVTRNNPTASDNFSGMYLASMLVKTNSPDTLEKVRTLLSHYTAMTASSVAPETFGEMRAGALKTYNEIGRTIFTAIGTIVLVAGCSLTVNLSGSIIERRRPYTLLRLAGTPVGVLRKALLLESTLPLIVASLFAASIGYALSIMTLRSLARGGATLPTLGTSYFLSVSAGLALTLLLVLATMPLIDRVTKPDKARFE